MTVLHGERLTRTFGEGAVAVTAVRDVTISLEASEVVLLLGPSGSGKTTLISMLGGLLRPTQGAVYLDGTPLDPRDSRTPAIRLRSVGFVFQSFNLLPALSTLDNVALPLRLIGRTAHASNRRAMTLLRMLGLEERARTRPDALSVGEKQRVSIARALVGDPRVVLADEPTASLDTKHGQEAMSLLTSLARQGRQACLIVTHDQRLTGFADRVVHLEDGRLAEA